MTYARHHPPTPNNGFSRSAHATTTTKSINTNVCAFSRVLGIWCNQPQQKHKKAKQSEGGTAPAVGLEYSRCRGIRNILLFCQLPPPLLFPFSGKAAPLAIFYNPNKKATWRNNTQYPLNHIQRPSHWHRLSLSPSSRFMDPASHFPMTSAMLSVVITVVCFVCYCCHRTIKKRSTTMTSYRHRWMDTDPNMEIYSVEQVNVVSANSQREYSYFITFALN